MTFTNEEGEQEKEDLTYNRQDFWVTTSIARDKTSLDITWIKDKSIADLESNCFFPVLLENQIKTYFPFSLIALNSEPVFHCGQCCP